MPTRRRVAIYTRISLDRTGESLSPERQETLCRQLAEGKGWEVAAVCVDRDKSGWDRGVRRPGFEALKSAVARRDVNAVMAYSLSRIGRRATDLLQLLEFLDGNGAVLALYDQQIDTSTAAGKMFFTVVAALAEMEADQTSERVKSAHKVAAARGHMHSGGSRQFGYDRTGVIIPSEALIVREVAERIMTGDTLWKIAIDLNDRKVPTSGFKRLTAEERTRLEAGEDVARTPGVWRAETVGQMIRSPRLAGIRVHGDDTHDGSWEPILDRETFAAVHDRLEARANRTERSVGSHLLTGLTVCAECGCRMKTSGFRMKNGRRFPRYACIKQPGHGNCGHVSIAKDSLDAYIVNRLFDFLSDRRLTLADPEPDVRAELERTIAEDTRALEELANDRYVSRTITAAEHQAARTALHERLEDAEARLRDLRRSEGERERALTPGERSELEEWWEAATPQQRRDALARSIKQITIRKAAHRGGRVFNTSRVEIEWRWDLYIRAAERWAETATPEDWAEAEEEAGELAVQAEAERFRQAAVEHLKRTRPTN